jgi:membrane fusion protein
MLFRKEVLEARRTEWLGGIALSQPLSLRLLAWSAAAAALAIVLLLILGSYTRRSRVEGELVPVEGLATVVAPAAGVVTRLDAAEGAAVDVGAKLAIVTMPRTIADQKDAGTAIALQLERRRRSLLEGRTAEAASFDAQRTGLLSQLTTGAQELRQIEDEIALRERQVRIAEETATRFRQLRTDHYVSDVQLREQESAALEQRTELQSLLRQAAALRRQLAGIRQTLDALPAQRRASGAEFDRDIASVEQESVEAQARNALAVVSPISGVIAAQLVKRGQSVEPGQPIVSVIPGNGRLEAELRVPSRAIGFVEPGDAVLLRYQAFPYQKFGHHTGRVARISRSALNDGGSGAEPYYRVVVALDRQTVEAYGRAESLKPGMRLEADILGERRRLIEWIFEPLYSLKGNVAGR